MSRKKLVSSMMRSTLRLKHKSCGEAPSMGLFRVIQLLHQPPLMSVMFFYHALLHPTRVTPTRPPPPAVKSVSFEEFEGRGTVFDELEWRAIDDKLALSQILGNMRVESAPEFRISSKSAINEEEGVRKPLESLTNGSKPLTVSTIPPYPVLEFGGSSKSDELVVLNSAGKAGSASFSKAANPVSVKETIPSLSSYESPLRSRLLTKGYRENLVNVALEKLPRERLPHVEYYMKGMSILEKRDVDATKTVIFLLNSNLTDKQAVVQRAQNG
ncbi:hypothetical protein KIN20_022123 [Parelaphostrongylus tenuis]|uniref:Uncharacterized protein n=1 Tax=Parelaphostrongylus tenuis TaxID=148309 RepID=A0AAD5NBE7_PARTN|nr:hypothetical protein KIN20_022123 [Parelaphostrongylus tenuis]